MHLRWRPLDADEDDQRYQVVTVQNDKIREMAEYRTLAEAMRVAKQAAGAPAR
jgi:hypothetical protein